MLNLPYDISTLFHGTIYDFSEIDISKCKPYKDFGIGFYTFKQSADAIKMAKRVKRIATEKAQQIKQPLTHIQAYLYKLSVDIAQLERLMASNSDFLKYFPEANIEWLDFVLLNRASKITPHKHAIVIGPTADDDTKACLNAYNRGFYGNPESLSAKETLIKNLETENLPPQIYFATPEAAKAIKIVKVDKNI